MSNALYNLAAMTVASTGTGTITLGAAAKISGVQYLSFASAGVPDGALVYYSINDPGGSGASEVGSGTYTSSGTSLTRTPITSTNANAAINMSASAIVRISPPTSQLREVLPANRTYYVRPDGSNSNTGLVNSSGGAFLTIQKAIDVVAELDISIYAVTIQVAAGTYTGSVTVTGPFPFGNGVVTVLGDATTPSNVVLSTTSAAVFTVTRGAILSISGVKMQTTTSGTAIDARTNSIVTMSGNFEIGATASGGLRAQTGASIDAPSLAIAVSGSGPYLFRASPGGSISAFNSTITLSGTPAFSSYTVNADRLGLVSLLSATFAGTGATGKRYEASANGVVYTNTGDVNFIPGNSVGTTATGGQYT